MIILISILSCCVGCLAYRMGRSKHWYVVYLSCLAVFALFALVRWFPILEFRQPSSWLVAGNREFAVVLTCVPAIFLVLFPKLKARLLRGVTVLFMAIVMLYFSVPFTAPLLVRKHLLAQSKQNPLDGIYRQSTGYTCGPAAAVTALRQVGMDGRESDIAFQASTNPLTGTQAESLCRSLSELYGERGLVCDYRPFPNISALPRDGSCIVVIKYAFLVDHFVTVLSIDDESVTLGDPLAGKRRLSHAEFRSVWRGTAIVLRHAHSTSHTRTGA